MNGIVKEAHDCYWHSTHLQHWPYLWRPPAMICREKQSKIKKRIISNFSIHSCLAITRGRDIFHLGQAMQLILQLSTWEIMRDGHICKMTKRSLPDLSMRYETWIIRTFDILNDIVFQNTQLWKFKWHAFDWGEVLWVNCTIEEEKLLSFCSRQHFDKCEQHMFAIENTLKTKSTAHMWASF